MCKKTISLILAILMVLGCASAAAETSKQEKVYVVAGADGKVASVTDSVRLENGDKLDIIEDQTLLTNIENLSGEETFQMEGNALTWKANGQSIVYQGTSDKAPIMVPVVTITLDGKEVSAADLKEREGEAVLKVTYSVNESVPAMAVTGMLLPETGISDLKMENAFVVTEMGRQILIGYAVPGASAMLNLPDSFSVSFHADHVRLDWMMTVVTAEPIRMICEAIDGKTDIDPHAELEEISTVLFAMSLNETIPETTGTTKELVPKLNELNSGLIDLDDGAKQLADGARQLYGSEASAENGTAASGAIALADGAAELDNGLTALTQNNEALNSGAEEMFAAILDAANEQLAASGLAKAGISIPVLTAENYDKVLDKAVAQLDPEALKAAAYPQVEAIVRPKVDAQEAQIRAGVEETVKAKVLEEVLAQVIPGLTAERYEAAVRDGTVDAKQAAQISSAVDARMESEETKTQINAAVEARKDEIVKENVEQYLASDETFQAKLAEARTASDSLKALKTKLDRARKFVDGLKEYTGGVARSADGASKLKAGAEQMKEGTALLAQGADSLYTNGTQVLKKSILKAEAELAQKLLPVSKIVLPKVLSDYEQSRELTRNAHYDLAPEGIRITTMYLIRTDL